VVYGGAQEKSDPARSMVALPAPSCHFDVSRIPETWKR
jgi:hypothetical protein